MALLWKLDGLPLAISQAGRFIHTLDRRPSTYLDIYAESRREAMDSLPDDLGSRKNLWNSIRTTWSMSVGSLGKKAEAGKNSPENCHSAAYRVFLNECKGRPADTAFKYKHPISVCRMGHTSCLNRHSHSFRNHAERLLNSWMPYDDSRRQLSHGSVYHIQFTGKTIEPETQRPSAGHRYLQPL